MKMTGKKYLQIAVAIGGLVPVGAGLAGMVLGPAMIPDAATSLNLDSHFRYLSGLLLGLGVCFWSCIPHIERQGPRFRLLTLIVFIGGLGRLGALLAMGIPDHSMLFGLGMELAVTPLLALWQHRISRA